MKVAICGYPTLAQKIQEDLKDSGIEIKFFIKDLVWTRGKTVDLVTDLPQIKFFKFRRLVHSKELDGIIIAENGRSNFTKKLVPILKFYEIFQVGVMDLHFPNPVMPVYWLDPYKFFLPYLESDIIEVCNLKCRGCYHFANFSCGEDIYPLKNFQRDMSRIAQTCDIVTFRLLGGEPLLVKNLDEYIKTARQYLPKSNLGIVTNGLLIPSLPQKILESLRENKVLVYVSVYEPTKKILDKIKTILDENKILYTMSIFEKFLSRMTLNGNHDPLKTRSICSSDVCRSMLNGKIYKCPIDAFTFKLVEKFEIKNFPMATGVDIYSSNFLSLIKMLDDSVELCYWCGDKHRRVQWSRSDNPELEDWLADPDELKNLLGG